MDLHTLLPQVIAVAEEAGSFIRKERDNFDLGKVEVKAKNDLVSYVDKTSEQIIVSGLKKILPGSGFIAEEGSESFKAEYNWIIDPLDGTTNFVHGIPCYAVSIGLEFQGEVILGVVHEVSRREMFSAAKDCGAFLNGQPIHVSGSDQLKNSLIATGFPVNNFSKMEAYLKTIDHFMRNTHGIRRIGAAAADLCYLACGRVDAFFEFNLSPWDVAAGSLIAQEAGAKVSDFRGGDEFLFGRQIMASNQNLFPEFSSVISTHFKD